MQLYVLGKKIEQKVLSCFAKEISNEKLSY